MKTTLPAVDLFTADELGNTSYLISDPDTGDAVVVDPFRDVAQYLDRSEATRSRIRATLETHVHNDFVSGARELEREVGAKVVAAADAGLEFPHQGLRHGSEIRLGRWRLQARHTPGHTPAHLAYVLAEEDGSPIGLFSGGALMVGTAARTDLMGPDLALPLAAQSFKTLHETLRDLPDRVGVYPTHGAGSFCGAGSSERRLSTMGDERHSNPLLEASELLPFLARAMGQGPYPAYYARMAPLNRVGAPLVGRDLPPLPRLAADEVARLQREGAALVDLRHPLEYDRGHIPGSFNVGNETAFSAWIGWVIPIERPLVLVGGDEGRYRDCHRQLFRIGYDRILGAMAGGMEGWADGGGELTQFETGSVDDLVGWLTGERPVTVLDVRDEAEWVHGHVPGAVHLTVPQVHAHPERVPSGSPVVVHCAAGYRAGLAASILEQAGVRRIVRIEGGFPDWEARGLPAIVPG